MYAKTYFEDFKSFFHVHTYPLLLKILKLELPVLGFAPISARQPLLWWKSRPLHPLKLQQEGVN